MNINTHSDDAKSDQIFNDIRLKEINRFSISSKPIRKLSSCLSKLKIDALSQRAMHLGIENRTMKSSNIVERQFRCMVHSHLSSYMICISIISKEKRRSIKLSLKKLCTILK